MATSPLPEPFYDDGQVTIYNADCRDVLPHLDPDDVSLVLTDPPYGINLSTTYRSNGRNRAKGRHAWEARDHAPVAGDDRPFDPSPLMGFGKCVLFGANNYSHHLPGTSSWIVWDRASGIDDTADAELAWTNLGGTVRMFRHMWTGYRRQSEIGFHVHPTQKPVALMRWIIDRWTEPGDLVLDPYMGSGPVAQACHEMGRRYIGVELVEDYCRVAVGRLSQQTLDLDGGAA